MLLSCLVLCQLPHDNAAIDVERLAGDIRRIRSTQIGDKFTNFLIAASSLDIEGRLVDMLQDTLRFLDLHLPRPHHIRGLEPEGKPEFPVEVLREALVNAVAHRDYTISAPIRVLIFDDRIEIRTPGQLPNTVTLDSLRVGVHVLRNPTLYNILLKRGLVTDAGSGIPRMIRVLREATQREPRFCLEGNEFVVVLPRSLPATT